MKSSAVSRPIEIGRPAPYAVLLTKSLLPKFLPSKKEMELQLAGFKENNMPHRAFYWDNDTRSYEEVGL